MSVPPCNKIILLELLNARLLHYVKKLKDINAIYCLNISAQTQQQLKAIFAKAHIKILQNDELIKNITEPVDLILANFAFANNPDFTTILGHIKCILDENGVFVFAILSKHTIELIKKSKPEMSASNLLNEQKVFSKLKEMNLLKFSAYKTKLMYADDLKINLTGYIILAMSENALQKLADSLLYPEGEMSEEEIDAAIAGEVEEDEVEKPEVDEEPEEEDEDDKEVEAEENDEGEKEENETDSESERDEIETEEETETTEGEEKESQENEELESYEEDENAEEGGESEAETEKEEQEENDEEQTEKEDDEEDEDEDEDEEEEDEKEEENEKEEVEEIEEEKEEKEVESKENEPAEHEEHSVHEHHEESEDEKGEKHHFFIEQLELNKEKLDQHAERLQYHLESGAQILKKLASSLTPAERQNQQLALQNHYQEHKEMITNYKELHTKHSNLVNDFMTSHAATLEKSTHDEARYAKLISEHKKALEEHEEKINEHEDLFNIEPPLN